MAGGLRGLRNEELHNLYASPNIIRMIRSRKIRWTGHTSRMGEMRNTYKILVLKPEGNTSLGRFRRKLEDNIRMNLKEIGREDVA
jgi:hypothetical protein